MTISAQGEQTKAVLLRAARAEFAEYGLAGARTDRIAVLAGVNKQRIYAYFGSKERLFTAVIADALDDLLAAISIPERGKPAEVMADYVSAVAAYHRARPELLRLLQWEALELGSDVQLDDERSRKYSEKVDRFANATGLGRAQAAHVLLATIGLAAWPVMMPQLTRLILGRDLEPALDAAIDWSQSIAASVVGD